MDAAPEAGADVAPEVGLDAGPDVALDVGLDVGLDARSDAPPDVGTDVPPDAGLDAAVDAPSDVPPDVRTDVPADSGVDVPRDVPGVCSSLCAPRPVSPVSASVVSSRRPALRWALSTGTDGAQVELCRDRAFETGCVRLDATGTGATPSADLAAGVWFWRLRGRAAGVTGADASATWMFTVGARSAAVASVVGSTTDFNADGYADLLVGGPWETAGWVFLASSAGFTSAPSSIGLSQPSPSVSLSRTLCAAGDVNGDGYSDVVGFADPGSPLLFMGGASGLSATPVVFGPPGAPRAVHVAGVGDMNGDGYADVTVVRSPTSDSNHALYLHLGSAAGLSATAAQVWTGPLSVFDRSLRVRSAGDVNGDGYADLAVTSGSASEVRIYHGAPTIPVMPATVLRPSSASPGFVASGAGDLNGDGYGDVFVVVPSGGALVYLGSATGLAASPAASIAASQSSRPVAVGDLNGDGYADLAFTSDPSASPATAATMAVHFGAATGIARTPSQTLSGATGSGFGYGVAGPGDVNGDGYADLAVGAAAISGSAEGRVTLHLGGAAGAAVAPTGRLADPTERTLGTALALAGRTYLATSMGAVLACAGDRCQAADEGILPGEFGAAVAATGTDPYRPEAIVGAPRLDRAFVYRHTPSEVTAITLVGPAASGFGSAVAGGADVDGDRFLEVAVGAPDSGQAFVFPGSLVGTLTSPLATLSGPAGSRFGQSLALVGDVNGDAFADLLVGAPMADRAYLYLGTASGLPAAPTATLSGPAGSRFGAAVTGVGDLDADGRADVLVGAPMADRAYLYLGAAGGLAATPVSLSGPSGSQFGASLSGSREAGLLIGAPGAGRAYVHPANPALAATALATLTGAGRFGSAVVFDFAGAAVVAAPDRGAVTRFVRPTLGWAAAAPVATAVSGVNTGFGAWLVTRLY